METSRSVVLTRVISMVSPSYISRIGPGIVALPGSRPYPTWPPPSSSTYIVMRWTVPPVVFVVVDRVVGVGGGSAGARPVSAAAGWARAVAVTGAANTAAAAPASIVRRETPLFDGVEVVWSVIVLLSTGGHTHDRRR